MPGSIFYSGPLSGGLADWYTSYNPVSRLGGGDLHAGLSMELREGLQGVCVMG